MEQNKDFLVKEPIGKLLFRLAIPTVIAQMINMLYNIVDRIYIGHIPEVGALALTGVGVCMPLIMILSAFAALVGNGGAPRASILLGKGDSRSAEKIIGNCFTLQILISIVLTVIMLLGGKTFLLAFGASENTIEYAVSYFNIYAIGTIFVQLTLGMNMFITAQGFTKIGMYSVLIQRHAVCDASFAGPWTRSAANYELQLRSQKSGPGKGCIFSLIKSESCILHYTVGVYYDISTGICRNLYHRCGAACIYQKSTADLSRGNVPVWNTDFLPDGI